MSTSVELTASAWRQLLTSDAGSFFLSRLPAWLKDRRWFSSKAREIEAVSIQDHFPIGGDKASPFCLLLIEVRSNGRPAETFLLPIGFAYDVMDVATVIADAETPEHGNAEYGLIYDAIGEERLGQMLLEAIASQHEIAGDTGRLRGNSLATLAERRGPEPVLPVRLLGVEQSNNALIYGDRFLLKLFRRLEPGLNPDLELGRFLTESVRFPYAPPVAGSLEYVANDGESSTVGILQAFVPNRGNAWEMTLEHVRTFFERLRSARPADLPLPADGFVAASSQPLPDVVRELCGEYLAWADLLGERTADLHRALASSLDQPDFAPEPFSPAEQAAMNSEFQAYLQATLALMKRKIDGWPADLRRQGETVLAQPETIGKRFQRMSQIALHSRRIRCHGDYHLGQVLFTGTDFVIIDFEGEPARSLADRRRKRSPLRDVAGMMRSFDYAGLFVVWKELAPGSAATELPRLERGSWFWSSWASVQFLSGYRRRLDGASIAAWGEQELTVLLKAMLVEKAVYEIAYELNNRPEDVRIPLTGLLRLMEGR